MVNQLQNPLLYYPIFTEVYLRIVVIMLAFGILS